MQVLRTNRMDENFYRLLGPIFGSRLVERMTRDRFYDDPGKEWYLIPDLGAASVLDHTIRNFWAVDASAAADLLGALLEDYRALDGVLPNAYADVFQKMGFRTAAYRKNFIEVYYEKD